MDSFSQLLVNGDATALNLAKTLLSTPMLMYKGETADKGANYIYKELPFSIPLETETHQKNGTAEVSESLVIGANQKTNMADNIAPGPWSWTLAGYIPGNAALEPSNFFTPFVKLNTVLLENAFKKGLILVFKDIDCQIYKRVVIQALSIVTQKDCRNKTPFSMTLKEINVVEQSTTAEDKANPSKGTAAGSAASAGTTLATVLLATAAAAIGISMAA